MINNDLIITAPAPQSAAARTPRCMPAFVRLLVVLGTALAVVLALPGAASAATYAAGNWRGDVCTPNAWGRIADSGASKGCVLRGAFAPSSYVVMQAGVYDSGNDIYAVHNKVEVLQWYQNNWTKTAILTWAVNVTGYGTSTLARAERVDRVGAASHLAVRLTTCAYHAPTNTTIRCGTVTSPAMSWATLKTT